MFWLMLFVVMVLGTYLVQNPRCKRCGEPRHVHTMDICPGGGGIYKK